MVFSLSTYRFPLAPRAPLCFFGLQSVQNLDQAAGIGKLGNAKAAKLSGICPRNNNECICLVACSRSGSRSINQGRWKLKRRPSNVVTISLHVSSHASPNLGHSEGFASSRLKFETYLLVDGGLAVFALILAAFLDSRWARSSTLSILGLKPHTPSRVGRMAGSAWRRISNMFSELVVSYPTSKSKADSVEHGGLNSKGLRYWSHGRQGFSNTVAQVFVAHINKDGRSEA
ncbi:hypothetical protein V8F06_012531 [Rhypophila decipiens]